MITKHLPDIKCEKCEKCVKQGENVVVHTIKGTEGDIGMINTCIECARKYEENGFNVEWCWIPESMIPLEILDKYPTGHFRT